MLLAVALSLLNLVESFVYMILLPTERWILVGTVTLRTLLLLVVALDFLGQIWPAPRQVWLRRAASIGAAAGLLAALLFGLLGAPRMAQAYADRRLAENPCADAVRYLQAQAAESPLTTKIATTELAVWRNLYPWLRQRLRPARDRLLHLHRRPAGCHSLGAAARLGRQRRVLVGLHRRRPRAHTAEPCVLRRCADARISSA